MELTLVVVTIGFRFRFHPNTGIRLLPAYDLPVPVIPIQIIRVLFLTGRAFTKRIRYLLRHQQTMEHINDRYSDPTAKELANESFCVEQIHVLLRLALSDTAAIWTFMIATVVTSPVPSTNPIQYILHPIWAGPSEPCRMDTSMRCTYFTGSP